MPIYKSVSELIGKTPMIELSKIKNELSLNANIFAKLEYFNPAGSVKDRVAKAMIEDAERRGKLKEESVIIEPTSGNTGIGLAAVGAALGYRVVIVMPDTMSEERRKLISAYGAELVLTDGGGGMRASIEKARELERSIPNSIVMGQFENPANKHAHFSSTGPEIYSDMKGKIDVFVAGVGTGGTISGVGEYLKNENKDIKIVAVEPYDSAVLSGEAAGPHALQGIGVGFAPELLNTEIYDEIIKVKTEEAYAAARIMAKREGILAGISSGAALYAAQQLAKREEYFGKNIVVLFPDGGDKYLSTGLFE